MNDDELRKHLNDPLRRQFLRHFKVKDPKRGWHFVQTLEIDPRLSNAEEKMFPSDPFDWCRHITIAKIARNIASEVEASGTRCSESDVMVLWIDRLLTRVERAEKLDGRPDQVPEDQTHQGIETSKG